ncbi:uncharacterized protein LOC124420920 [Lucilia cuprina]|uniref:uncharacterized protein LOC124420920 n=1 Tax=Lucilia cuprina TaxID=7375 RepID=UPI001F063103|nr:uncharacterized protein LOC124420920 [Lucilia cuprina]
MPDSFSTVITAIETLSPETLEMEFIKNRLLEEDRKKNHHINQDASEENIAMKTSFKWKCHYCGKKGHKKKNCFKWKRDQSNKNVNTAETGNNAISSVAEKVCLGSSVSTVMKWVLDSGASDHMAKYEHFFENLQELDDPVFINVAKNKQPYGLALDSQNEVLTEMNQIMSIPIIPGRKCLEPFQKGILMTNNALIMLHEYVKKYDMKYIVTSRLNQDVLEHFFGAIRSKGGLNDHSSPRDFKFRLRKYILAKNTEHLNGKGNVEVDTTEWLNCSNDLIVPPSQNCGALGTQDPTHLEESSPDFG